MGAELPIHFDVVVNSDDVLIAHAGDLCIAIPRGKATKTLVERMHRGISMLAKKRSIALLFIVSERATPPDSEGRAAVAKMFEELRASVRAFAAVIAGSGFKAAIKRSVFGLATGTMLGKIPVKAFAHAEDASRWLFERCSTMAITAPDVDAIVAFVRQQGE